jgi:hypothetical protein
LHGCVAYLPDVCDCAGNQFIFDDNNGVIWASKIYPLAGLMQRVAASPAE